jgi:hypothetical protein
LLLDSFFIFLIIVRWSFWFVDASFRRDVEFEESPNLFARLHRNLAVQSLHNHVADVQANSDALRGLLGGRGLLVHKVVRNHEGIEVLVRIKDSLELLLLNAVAFIADLYVKPIIFFVEINAEEDWSMISMNERVVHQISDHLLQALLVGEHS